MLEIVKRRIIETTLALVKDRKRLVYFTLETNLQIYKILTKESYPIDELMDMGLSEETVMVLMK